MVERTQVTSVKTSTGWKRSTTLFIAGSVAAVLTAGVLFQIFRAEPTDAAVDPGDAGTASVGTARVGGSSRSNGANVARVNGELISRDQVATECFNRHGQEILASIINRTIIQQACESRGIQIPANEIDQEIVKIAQKFDLPVASWFQMLKSERDITPAQYRRDVIWPMLALRKLAGVDVEVTEKDLQEAFIREYGPRVKVRMIMLDNFRRANEVWEEAKRDPENFGRLAREHSVEPTSRALDGVIPPIRQHSGAANEELVKAAFKLRTGEISGIIQAGHPGATRYVILLSEGQTDPVLTNINEVREELHTQLREIKIQETAASVFDDLKKASRIDNYLTNASTVGVQQTSGTAPRTPQSSRGAIETA